MSAERSLAEATAPGILTPVQWYEGVHRDDAGFHPTKQLMLAVLVDAVQRLQNRRTAAEVEEWIADRGGQGPFAFEAVCSALGIDPDYLRNGLSAWYRGQLSAMHQHRRVRHLLSAGRTRIESRRRRRSCSISHYS